MTILHEMAKKFAAEMIEHNLNCGATSLNTTFIAEQACELAYKIDHKIKEYNVDKITAYVTKPDLDRALEHLSPKQPHSYHHQSYVLPNPVPMDE